MTTDTQTYIHFFNCYLANFGLLSRDSSHSPNVNCCVIQLGWEPCNKVRTLKPAHLQIHKSYSSQTVIQVIQLR